MSQDEEGGLIKSYGYLIAIVVILGIFYFLTQNPTINPKEPPEDMKDAKINFGVEGEVWEKPLHLVKTPYDCRDLYNNPKKGLSVKTTDVELKVSPDSQSFTIPNIGEGGTYRFCSYTDYGGVVESDRFTVVRNNETIDLQNYNGGSLESNLKMKEYFEGKLQQYRSLEINLYFAELEPI